MRIVSSAHLTSSRKRHVNLTLDEALVGRAKGYTDNLSATVESLLGQFVEDQQREQLETVAKARKCSANWNAVNEALGSFAEEYSTL
jgi:antitoxin CcdA